MKKILLPKRVISLDKVEETFPTFYQRFLESDWICFAAEPCKVNEQWVREFYANLVEIDMASRLIRIRGNVVDYGPEVFNRELKMHNTLSLVVPSLIMELCKRAKVEVLPSDTWMEPKIFIFPLKMRGEGLVVKIKKMKIDYDKSVHVVDDSPMHPVVGPFYSLASELRVVQELVEKLPQGTSESSAGPRSYVPQSEFDAYLSDQGKQKSQLANLRRPMLAWPSHMANEPLPLSRSDDEEDEPDTWSDDGRDEDREATETSGED
ncbi:hypothetical protein H5410_061009 [Solanum commersonii]|uniref:Uncharacterized protein n=1 Tax=Solanum commersonii TaxID=4109 RepID=A0A9J5W6J8_SOLCO|nr:hypothetical protein H5410_061009 [Solanum commersonii]